MDEAKWFWASEHGRDRLLKEAVEEQNAAMAAAHTAARRDTAKLRSELVAMQGSVESRLQALTNAFVAFVELDSIRKELAAYPEHAKARRHALEDLQNLIAGHQPPAREDVDGYWLPPAMAALRSDGTVDPEKEAEARRRDPETTRFFFPAAQAALGNGAAVAQELSQTLQPASDGTWSQRQVLVWATVLRGAFGEHAIAGLGSILIPIVQEAEDWQDWAQHTSLQTTEAGALDWVGSQIESLRPKLSPAQESSWLATASGRENIAVSAHSSTPLRVSQPEPGEESDAATQQGDDMASAEAWEATRALLLQICQQCISGGSGPEQHLLARAALLEEQFSNPRGAKAVPDEVTEQRQSVLGLLRSLALDPHASRQDRHWLWRVIGHHFTGIAREFALEPKPSPVTEPVAGFDLVAGPTGLIDESAAGRLRRALEGKMPTQQLKQANIAKYGGIVLLILALGFLLFGAELLALLGALLGAALTYFGWNQVNQLDALRHSLISRQKALEEAISRAVDRAAKNQRAAVARHEERVDAAKRFLSTVRELGIDGPEAVGVSSL